ncbi:hypothetical protein AGMMS50230_20500 [Spirochaetia bacterium]|nr:hypothetical protein AGMMS50230_20500 [Spirochaetia bacterium]
MIITIRGAVRLSSVAAELNSGAISEKEANPRRNELKQECDFLGSLDGAMNFIYGTFKIEIFLLCIGITGSIIIAAMNHGESFSNLKPLIMDAAPSIYYLTIGFYLIQFTHLFMVVMAGRIIIKKAG